MKRQRSAWLAMALCGSVVAPMSLQAQQETKRSKIVIIENGDEKAESASSSGDKHAAAKQDAAKKNATQKQYRSHTAVVTAGGDDTDKIIAAVEKQLESSGVDEATRKNVVDKLRAHFKDQASSGKSHEIEVKVQSNGDAQEPLSIDMKLDGEAIVVDKDGKEQRVRLNGLKGSGWQALLKPDQGSQNNQVIRWMTQEPGNTFQWTFQPDEMSPAQKEKLQAILKKLGVANESIEVVMKEMSAGDSLNLRSEQEERFVIGVALKRANSDEMEEEEDEEEEDEDEGEEEESEEGLSVIEVFEGSPADKAGIEAGDVLLTADGKDLESMGQLIEMIQEAGNANRGIKVDVLRGDKSREVTITPRKEVVAVEMNTLPSDLKEALSSVRQNRGGFVVPQQAMEWMKGPMEDMSGLKGEIESLKKEMKELRSLLKSMKKD